MSNEKPLSWEETREVINSLIENWQQHHFGVWAVVYKKHQKLIGTEAASSVLKYGFEVAKLERIVAVAKPENIASRRVMEKVGLKYKKDAYYYNNDVVYYSLSREAYQLNAMRLKRTTNNENFSPPIAQVLDPVFS
jgi:ribosomal-protein-alanine N-acetyltransferase